MPFSVCGTTLCYSMRVLEWYSIISRKVRFEDLALFERSWCEHDGALQSLPLQ